MGTKGLVNLNNHLLCAVDVETTGLKPGWHEVIQIGILPLDSELLPREDLPPFDFRIRPSHPDRVDPNAMRVHKIHLQEIMDDGFEQEVVVDRFYHWFKKCVIGEDRKIVPLCHNSMFDLMHLVSFFGWEDFYDHFHGHVRDLQAYALGLNDRSEFQAERTPFAKLNLRWIANHLDVEYDPDAAHDALYDCLTTARCYKKILYKTVGL